jgi:putative transposase
MDGKDELSTFFERLWRTVKYENVYLQAYTENQPLQDLKDYFEFYNYGDFISH